MPFVAGESENSALFQHPPPERKLCCKERNGRSPQTTFQAVLWQDILTCNAETV